MPERLLLAAATVDEAAALIIAMVAATEPGACDTPGSVTMESGGTLIAPPCSTGADGRPGCAAAAAEEEAAAAEGWPLPSPPLPSCR